MAKQTIGTGTTANDGTGDTERAAWIKANANFGELYAAVPAPPTAASSSTNVSDVLFEAYPTETILNEKGGNDSVPVRITRVVSKQVQGTNTYYDTVTGYSINMDTAFNLVNPKLGAGRFAIESKYRQGQGQPLGTELHISAIAATQDEDGTALSGGGGGNEYRMVTGFVPHKYSDWGSVGGMNIRGAQIVLNDGWGSTPVQFVFTRATTGVAVGGSMSINNVAINQQTNNKQWLTQKNAAGTLDMSLPFIGTDDILVIAGSYRQNGSLAAANNNGNKALVDITAGGTSANSYYRIIAPSLAVTGDQWGDKLSATCTGNFIQEFRNYNASGSLIQRLTGKSRSFTSFSDEGSKQWSVGIDMSADSYNICGSNENLTTNQALKIDRTTLAAVFGGSLTSKLSTGGIGYSTGAGGTVTQATSKSTGVTLNKVSGQITMNAAALAASTSVAFTLTNSTIAAGDVVIVSIASGATSMSYMLQVEATAAGSCSIQVRNVSGGSLSEAIALNFAVIKAVAA